ncbi:chitin synthase, class [Anopheles sinensis]|uniref:Chitin synthase, class n=1 Tax=Anopheles sinensis TaxID=74873 RepID=A0A084W4K4_ANOSI|nr:chitin synthase, class [Anopheles sinensis]
MKDHLRYPHQRVGVTPDTCSGSGTHRCRHVARPTFPGEKLYQGFMKCEYTCRGAFRMAEDTRELHGDGKNEQQFSYASMEHNPAGKHYTVDR